MATTKTEVTELVNAELIAPVLIDGARNAAVALPYCWIQEKGRATAVSFARKSNASLSGSATASVSEAGTISATNWETLDTTVTPNKLAFRVDITTEALEDNVFGPALYDLIVADCAAEIGVTFDRVITDLFTSITDSVGSSGNDLTLAQLVEARFKVLENGVDHAGGDGVYVLHTQQMYDAEAAFVASSATALASYYQRVDAPGSKVKARFMGHDVVSTSNVRGDDDTPANRVGAFFIRGNDASTRSRSAFGVAMGRDITMVPDFDNTTDTWVLVSTARLGAGLINDAAACKIATDA